MFEVHRSDRKDGWGSYGPHRGGDTKRVYQSERVFPVWNEGELGSGRQTFCRSLSLLHHGLSLVSAPLYSGNRSE